MTGNRKSLVWPLVALAAVLVLFVGVAYSIGSSQRAADEREQAAAAARKTQVPPQVKWTTSAVGGAFKFARAKESPAAGPRDFASLDERE